MEQTDEPDGSIDVVWCRDVLEVIPKLQAGLSETARVLKPGGSAVIYTVFAGPRLEPREAAAVNKPLGIVPRNLERAWVEIQRFGRDKYELWEASLHWLAYLLMGKVEPVAYVLHLP